MKRILGFLLAVGVGVGLVVGCSSAPEERLSQNGQVSVQVSGLPSNEKASVTLINLATSEVENLVFDSGSSSQSISLPQGTYQVTASTVFSGKNRRQVLSATVDKPVAHVVDDERTAVDVAYAAAHGLDENVLVLDDKEAASLIAVTDSELVFNNPSAKLANLQPGDVIIFETAPSAQSQATSQLIFNQGWSRDSNQFLVVAAEVLNSNLTIKYRRPTLTDLLPDIDRSFSARPFTMPIEFPVPVSLGSFSGSIVLAVQKLDIRVKGRKIRSSNPVTPPKVNGLVPVMAIPSGMCIEAGLSKIEVCRDWYVFEQYDVELAYELEAQASIKIIDADVRVPGPTTPVFTLGVIDILLGIDWILNGSLSIDLTNKQNVEASTHLQGVNGFLLPVTTSNSTPGEASIGGTLEAELIVETYVALTDRFWVAHAWTGLNIGIAGGAETVKTELDFDQYLDYFIGVLGGVRYRLIRPPPYVAYKEIFTVGEKDNIFRTSILRKSKLGLINFNAIPKNYSVYWRRHVLADGSKNVFASQYTTVPSKTRLEVWASRNDKGNLVEEDYLPITLGDGCTSLNGTSRYPKAALIDGLKSKEICELTVTLDTSKPRPAVTDIHPNPVTGSNDPQPISVLGSNFDVNAVVTLRSQSDSDPFVIPPERTEFVSSSQINVSVNLTTQPDTWTAQVTNPDEQSSNQLEFTVVAPPSQPQPSNGITATVDMSNVSPGNWHATILYPTLLSNPATIYQISPSAPIENSTFSLDLTSITPPTNDARVQLIPINAPRREMVDPPSVEGAEFSLIAFNDTNKDGKLSSGEAFRLLNHPVNSFGQGALNLQYASEGYTITGNSETSTGTPVTWNVNATPLGDNGGWGHTIYERNGDAVNVRYDLTLTGLELTLGSSFTIQSLAIEEDASELLIFVP